MKSRSLHDDFVLSHRTTKRTLNPLRAYSTIWEEERDSVGALASTAVVFLTNRECPFRIHVNPLSTELRNNYGFVLYMARRYSDAERELLRAIELEPRDVFAYIFLASAYLETGRLQEGLKYADRPELQASPILGRAYAALGRRDEALKVLGRIDAKANPNDVALMHFALGDDEKGFSWLSKAIDQRQGFVRWINVAPYFDRVRPDPRFVALVTRLKLPDSPTGR